MLHHRTAVPSVEGSRRGLGASMVLVRGLNGLNFSSHLAGHSHGTAKSPSSAHLVGAARRPWLRKGPV
jgi:hypothetical protein